jgi:hypothetical protein
MAQATAPILDSTEVIMPPLAGYGCSRMKTGLNPHSGGSILRARGGASTICKLQICA